LTDKAISLIALLANPEMHHQKTILVDGFLKLEHEGNCLYLHREDYEQGLSKNAIWVEVTEDIEEKLKELNLQYVMLVGVFDAHRKGHFDSCSGTIKGITRAEPTLTRADYEKLLDRYIDRNLQKLGLGPYGHLKPRDK
jgi:hypothetical protein